MEILRCLTVKENRVRIPRLLPRSLHEKVNHVLELLGGKWSRSLRGHLFDGDPWNAIADAVATGEVTDAKKQYQFFETPEGLARTLINMAEIHKGHRILEPSAGAGAIARHFGQPACACELQPHLHRHLADIPGLKVLCDDFMTLPNSELFDRIVANPPFRQGQDLAHVHKMVTHLKPGGILVSVMGPGWRFRTDRRHLHFRQWFTLLTETYWGALPPSTFAASGTMVNATWIKLVV